MGKLFYLLGVAMVFYGAFRQLLKQMGARSGHFHFLTGPDFFIICLFFGFSLCPKNICTGQFAGVGW